jgi:hypothetical protein
MKIIKKLIASYTNIDFILSLRDDGAGVAGHGLGTELDVTDYMGYYCNYLVITTLPGITAYRSSSYGPVIW